MIRRLLSRLRAHAAGLVRVLGLLALILSAAVTLSLRQAHAQLGESLFGFGEQLFVWENARPHSGVRSMYLNGARFRMLSMTLDEPLVGALDRFQADCERTGGLLGDLDFSPTIFRKEASSEGVLACFDTGGRKTTRELLARVERFTETGDLNSVGSFRYVIARSGGETTTALVLWTEGSVPLKEMFPKEGDAPGRDPEHLPRMPEAVRTLSAAESEQPYSATLYRVPSGSDPLGWYSRALGQAGWQTRETGRTGVLLASRGGRTVLIRATEGTRTIGILQLS